MWYHIYIKFWGGRIFMSTATNNTVLIVDDERNICELIRLYVEKEGFTACTVYDG